MSLDSPAVAVARAVAKVARLALPRERVVSELAKLAYQQYREQHLHVTDPYADDWEAKALPVVCVEVVEQYTALVNQGGSEKVVAGPLLVEVQAAAKGLVSV